jgi:hypothetical protein
MLQVLNVMFENETFQTFEREPDLLMISEALKSLKVFVDRTLHKFVDFLFQNIFCIKKHLPVSDHKYSYVLSRKSWLIEIDLKSRRGESS